MGRIAIVWVGLVTACGGDDLTCELLADPMNCWASNAAKMAACLPSLDAQGTLAADRTSCTFPDGARVVFDGAVPTDSFDLEQLAFTIEKGGTTCARFVDTFNNRMELTVGGETTVSELHNGSKFHLHCDGTDYESDFDLLFTCQTPYAAPTDGFEITPTSISFTISSVATPSVLFTCTI